MFEAGTRVQLRAAFAGHEAGSRGVVVYDLGNDVCQIVLDTGEQLILDCRVLAPLDEVAAD
jgi:hypothetical protein